LVRITFSTPESLPLDRDAYLGMGFGAPQANDGIRVFFTRYNAFAGLMHDRPGPRYRAAQDPAERVMYLVDAAGSVSTSALGHTWVVPLTTAPAGVCTAVTNQTLQPASNTAPGLANELSGRNPWARAGFRDDDPGFYFEHPDVAGGLVAFFLGAKTNTILSLGQFVPGADGPICLNLGSLISVGGGAPDASGAAWVVLSLPPAVRTAITNTDIDWWALSITPLGRFIASGCGRQRY
jgi:hypothetical protein